MPFNETTPLTINVTLADIAASSAGVQTNSLAIAIKRYADNLLLPGQQDDTVSQSCGVSVQITPRINNGQVVSVCEAYVCTAPYECDLNVTLIILLEMLGIKPTSAYTATLVHA